MGVKLGSRVKTKAVLGGSRYRRRSPPLTTEIRGFHPQKCVQNGAFWGKIALCFDYKQTAILTQTFGHKMFSEVE